MTARTCGTCKVCCRALSVEELEPPKRAGTWCRHCMPGAATAGCRIYADRPRQCAEYQCLWRQAPPEVVMPEDLRPDRSRVLLTFKPPVDTAPAGWVIAIEMEPGAARGGRGDAMPRFLHRLAEVGVPVVVSAMGDGARVVAILPAGWRPPADALVPATTAGGRPVR